MSVPEERVDSRDIGSRRVLFSEGSDWDWDLGGGKKTNVKQYGEWFIDRGTGALSVGSC